MILAGSLAVLTPSVAQARDWTITGTSIAMKTAGTGIAGNIGKMKGVNTGVKNGATVTVAGRLITGIDITLSQTITIGMPRRIVHDTNDALARSN